MFGGSTAMVRKAPSAPMRYWADQDLLQGSVLDFGSGNDDNGFTRYDIATHPDPAVLLVKYDTVICNYVLNVQPSDHLVTQLLVLMHHLIKPRGRVLVSVLTDGKAGAFSVGGTIPRTQKQWAAHISTIFKFKQVNNGFTGFICRRK